VTPAPASVGAGRRARRAIVRVFEVLAATILFAALFVGGWALWHSRDRNPDYAVDLHLIPTVEVRSGGLHAGFGRERITPDLARPVWLAGFANGRRATAIHDDLWAVAAVVDDGSRRVGIAALDAIGLFHDDVVAVRRLVASQVRLDYLVVASTHNHSTPDLMGLWGPRVGVSGVDDVYRARVIEGAAKAVVAASTALEPANVSFLELPLPTHGLVADSREPQVFDATLRMMHFTRRGDGRTIGSIVNWADHPETLWADNTEVTADFPGYLRGVLEHGIATHGGAEAPGLGGIHLYVNGAIGGLMTTNPETTVRDPITGHEYSSPSHEKARAVGRRLGDAILTSLRSRPMLPEPEPRLTIAARTLELALDNRLFSLASALGTIDRGQPHWNHIRTEVALVMLGDAAIGCIPGELYPEIANGGIVHPSGADFDVDPVEVPPLRALMPGRVKFLIGLANDEIGYIIPKSEWDDEPPWLYGGTERQYGEINSVGPETGPAIHRAFKALVGEPATPAKSTSGKWRDRRGRPVENDRRRRPVE